MLAAGADVAGAGVAAHGGVPRCPLAPFRAAELNRLADLPALHSLVPLFPHADHHHLIIIVLISIIFIIL